MSSVRATQATRTATKLGLRRTTGSSVGGERGVEVRLRRSLPVSINRWPEQGHVPTSHGAVRRAGGGMDCGGAGGTHYAHG